MGMEGTDTQDILDKRNPQFEKADPFDGVFVLFSENLPKSFLTTSIRIFLINENEIGKGKQIIKAYSNDGKFIKKYKVTIDKVQLVKHQQMPSRIAASLRVPIGPSLLEKINQKDIFEYLNKVSEVFNFTEFNTDIDFEEVSEGVIVKKYDRNNCGYVGLEFEEFSRPFMKYRCPKCKSKDIELDYIPPKPRVRLPEMPPLQLETFDFDFDDDDVKEEYMYRKSDGDKKERYEKSKDYYIGRLIALGVPEKELEEKSIGELGKMYSEKKKNKKPKLVKERYKKINDNFEEEEEEEKELTLGDYPEIPISKKEFKKNGGFYDEYTGKYWKYGTSPIKN